jgi:ribonuclease BN (tRNA processing enzyme)
MKFTITPLGTVSPYPKGNMNCPGFLADYNGNKILLDCGNGITSLLKMPDYLQKLYVIVTHYHKDHFSDLGALQYASYVYHNLGLLKNKIKIYLPKNDFAFNKLSILSNTESYADYFEIFDGYSFLLDDLKISFYDNKSHTIETFMTKIQSKDFKIVYTSDLGTTNLDNAAEFCNNSDLIICESSFLKKHNANTKTHLTAYDAAVLAKKSLAKKLLLTHFWPEENKTLYLEEAKNIFQNSELAEEGKTLEIT